MISSETTVRQVAVQLPESTRLFEKLNIDYCCGGNRTLIDACGSAGVEVDNVIELLAALDTVGAIRSGYVDFQKVSLAELIAYILEAHHIFTRSEMARIEALSAKVINAHSANHPELHTVENLFQRLCADLKPHMFKEEQVLFPYIVSMEQAKAAGHPGPFAPFGTVKNPIRMMSMEHDTAGEILRELRAATADYQVPDDACISYQALYRALEGFEKDLHQHIHLENNILFPRAIVLETR